MQQHDQVRQRSVDRRARCRASRSPRTAALRRGCGRRNHPRTVRSATSSSVSARMRRPVGELGRAASCSAASAPRGPRGCSRRARRRAAAPARAGRGRWPAPAGWSQTRAGDDRRHQPLRGLVLERGADRQVDVDLGRELDREALDDLVLDAASAPTASGSGPAMTRSTAPLDLGRAAASSSSPSRRERVRMRTVAPSRARWRIPGSRCAMCSGIRAMSIATLASPIAASAEVRPIVHTPILCAPG